ncbi:MAG: right-handed parallel beta-helix repeat-containing protein [Acidobacteriota bacterium]|nr:right-handed parallel beta-helix repeat-containing protein [Acidobacteriota bacterium]
MCNTEILRSGAQRRLSQILVLVLIATFAVYAAPAQAAIVLEQWIAAVQQSNTVIEVSFPTAPAEGNLLVAIVGNQDASDPPATPSGWVLEGGDSANSPGQLVYYKIAGAAESATFNPGTYSITASRGIHLYEYSGVDTGNPLASSARLDGTGTTLTTGSINTNEDGSLILVGFTIDANTACDGWTNGFVEEWDFTNGGAPSGKATYVGVDLEAGAAGTYSTSATTTVAGLWIGHVLVFNPDTSAIGDSDGDGLLDAQEDANTDLDDDPATTPGPDTDGDTFANYLDADDDGDGTPTASENADANADGDPRDALDSDRDGEPDYLDAPTSASSGTVDSEQKISDLAGGFTAVLDNYEYFGDSVAGIGDLDGDGIIDVAVGAWRDGAGDEGAVHVLFLNADGTVMAEQKISNLAGGLTAVLNVQDYLGAEVAGIGDIDGDGISDIAVGAWGDDDGGFNRGAVWVLFLNADGTVKAKQKISDLAGGLTAVLDDTDSFGSSVAGIGDLDGDGIGDMAVGAWGDDDGGDSSGAVHVLFLNADGTVRTEQKISALAGGLTATLGITDDFGYAVTGIGDLDGDGIVDMAVGAFGDDDGGTDRGAVHVLFLNADGTVKTEQKISNVVGGLNAALGNSDSFGASVAGIGDVDGDGIIDMVVGAFGDDDGAVDRGAVYVLFLNADGTVKAEQKISDLVGGLSSVLGGGDQFGYSVAGIGDVGGDGSIDLLVGTYADDDGGTDRGAVYVLKLAPPFTSNISGAVFEDADFSGVASAFDAGVNDLGLANVDVELYTDADVYVASVTTDGSGNYVFSGVTDGSYKVRVRSASIGDADTPPAGSLNASVPATWPYPLPELSWANGAALLGGQDATVDDTATGDDAGPGDTWTAVTVSGASVTGVEFGFAYNLIVNTADTGLTDAVRSAQGSLRQFLKNANAIGTTGATTANSSQFHMQVAAGQSDGADSWWRITPIVVLPTLTDSGTILDGATQTANGGDSNSRGPEVEIDGSTILDVNGLTLTSADHVINGLVINGFDNSPGTGIVVDGASATGVVITGCYLGTNAIGTLEVPNFYGITLSNGAAGTVIGGGGAGEGNVISGHNFYGIYIDNAGANTTIQGNRIGTNAAGDAAMPNSNGIYVDVGTAIVIGGSGVGEGNLISGNITSGINLRYGDDVTIQGNWMGLNLAGTDPLPDGGTAVSGWSLDNVLVGGPGPGEGNIIAGNDGFGISLGAGCQKWTIQGNTIGTGPLGTETNLGNTGAANIRISPNDITIDAVIGGEIPGEGNLIAYASGPGIGCVSLGAAVEIIGNVIRNNAEEGITARVDSLTVAMNLIYDNGAGFDAILIQDVASEGKIYQHTIHGSGDDGIEIEGLNHDIRNNVITGSAGYGINVNAGTITESNNLITGSATSPENALGRSNAALDASDLDADPLYVDAAGGDFSLAECSSPAINTGLDLGADQPDVNGGDTGLFTGPAPDMGVLETPCLAASTDINGRVFEDADFAGTASGWDGGVGDVGQPGVDVELYTAADLFVATAATDGSGNFTFSTVADGSYKVRVRAATLGDADTPPAGGLNASVPTTWPFPLPEMTWANGSGALGGQDATIDDTATGDDAGPGDTWAAVTVSGASVTGVDFGFAYNLIVHAGDDGLGDAARSDQGSLRQFLKNANAIGAAGSTTANSSQFHMQVAANQTNGGDTWWRIVPTTALPPLADTATTLDGSTQRINAGVNANTRGPEIEIHGNAMGATGLLLTSSGGEVRELVVNGFGGSGVATTTASATGNAIFGCYIGTDAVGEAALANTGTGIILDSASTSNDVGGINAGEGNLISGNGGQGIQVLSSATNRIRGNRIGVDRAATAKLPNGSNGIYLNGTASGNTIGGATAAARNIVSGNTNAGIWADFAQTGLTIQGNTVGTGLTGAETTLGNSFTGIRVSVATGGANVVVGGEGPDEGNLVAYNGQQGLYTVNAGPGVQFVGNDIHDNGFGGIYSRSDGVLIAKNLVVENGAGYPGIRIADEFGSAADNNEIYHNTVHGNGTDGVVVEGSGTTLRNNIVTGNGGYGLNVTGASTTESHNNVTDATTNPPNTSGGSNVALDASDLNVDPLYVDAAGGDYSLTECSSSAINTGLDLGVDQPDMNDTDPGNFNGPAPDMGGLETSCVTVSRDISGIVFEDTDFAGTASAYDGGTSDLALANVDVELYDGADTYLASTTTGGDGSYSFSGLADGTYKVRVRSATIGDLDTPPDGGYNADVPATWPYPLAEMAWGHGSALIGGQDADLDDTATGDNAGPGDCYVTVVVSGADVSGVNFGFSYELIVNEIDDANADNVRSRQGSLRQFIKNSNAIVGVNKSWFQNSGI